MNYHQLLQILCLPSIDDGNLKHDYPAIFGNKVFQISVTEQFLRTAVCFSFNLSSFKLNSVNFVLKGVEHQSLKSKNQLSSESSDPPTDQMLKSTETEIEVSPAVPHTINAESTDDGSDTLRCSGLQVSEISLVLVFVMHFFMKMTETANIYIIFFVL